ncbi:hypothetical protein FQR65_LT17353 [Abscondita terminalis]|nr:hypothetical protein FQR65_LT17353 [Abscondita terminalis]
MTITEQAAEVVKLKRSKVYESRNPVNTLLGNGYYGSGTLVGIVTNRDLRFQKDMKRPISELMTRDNLVVAPEGTDLVQAELILQNYKIEKLPVVNEEGLLKRVDNFKDIQKYKHYPNACEKIHQWTSAGWELQ